MLLDAFRLLLKLPIRPSKNAPAQVDQAVLPYELICVVHRPEHGGMMKRLTVNLDRIALQQRFQCKVDVSITAFQVFVAVLLYQLRRRGRPEHILEKLDEAL